MWFSPPAELKGRSSAVNLDFIRYVVVEGRIINFHPKDSGQGLISWTFDEPLTAETVFRSLMAKLDATP